ncbi:MAG: hypothetical protein ACOC57_07150 [Acidobacteriota bacterium]
MGLVTRSIPQRGILLPFGLCSPLLQRETMPAQPSPGIPHPIPFLSLIDCLYHRKGNACGFVKRGSFGFI